jgi:hypothetical protein
VAVSFWAVQHLSRRKPKQRESRPGNFSRRRIEKVGLWLRHDPVSPLAGMALRCLNLELHLFRYLPAEESADAVAMPVGRLRDLGQVLDCTIEIERSKIMGSEI